MKRLALLLLVVGVSVSLAATADVAPGAGCDAPYVPSDAWGQLIRSWSITQPSSGVKTGAACTNDNFWMTGAWSGFNAFGVYSTSGSFVRTVSASGISGFRDGTFRNHLGTGYFVIASGGPGAAVYFAYTAGGNPGSSVAGNLGFSCGRGIGWNGTYYYATTGSWSTPIGYYSTTGSLVGTLSAGTGLPVYGIGCAPGNPGYFWTWDQGSGSPIKQWTTAGSQVRSFTTSSSSAGGVDIGWSDGYLYCTSQTPATCFVYDGEVLSSVAPESLGTIKAIYR